MLVRLCHLSGCDGVDSRLGTLTFHLTSIFRGTVAMRPGADDARDGPYDSGTVFTLEVLQVSFS